MRVTSSSISSAVLSGINTIGTSGLSGSGSATSTGQIRQQIAAINKQISDLSSQQDNNTHKNQINLLKKQRQQLEQQLTQLQNSEDLSSTAEASDTAKKQAEATITKPDSILATAATAPQIQTTENEAEIADSSKAYQAAISQQGYAAMKTEQTTTVQDKEQKLLHEMNL